MPGGHWQLVAFTVATQLVVGAMVVLAIGMPAASVRFDPVEVEALAGSVLDAVVVLLAAGGAVAAAHLGSAGKAFKALANVRESWLSREAAAGIVFGLLATAAAIGYRLELGSGSLRHAGVVAAAVAGLGTVYAMARLYMLRTVPAWNTPATPVSFLISVGVLGSAAAVVVLAALSLGLGATDPWLEVVLPWVAWSCLALALAQLVVNPASGGFPTCSGMWLLNAALGLGGAGLLLGAALLANTGTISGAAAGPAAAGASVVLIVSEVIGRIRFYNSFERLGV